MEARELRIGNFIYEESDLNTPFILDELYKYDAEDYHPIPLTEEWLVKFGFEKQDNFTYLIDANDYAYLWIQIPGLTFSFGQPYEASGNELKIQFVHQLQNLYYCLTGKELEAK